MSTQPEAERDLLQRCVAKEPGAWSEFVDRYIGLVYHVIRHTARGRGIQLTDAQRRDLCEDVFAWVLADDRSALRGFKWQSHFVTWLAIVARRRIVHKLIDRSVAEELGHVPPAGTASDVPPPSAAAEVGDETVEQAVLIAPAPGGDTPAGQALPRLEPVLDAPPAPPAEPAPVQAPPEAPASPSSGPAAAAADTETPPSEGVDQMLDGLDWESAQVVRLRWVEDRAAGDIAREMGLSEERVNQILDETLERLREQPEAAEETPKESSVNSDQ